MDTALLEKKAPVAADGLRKRRHTMQRREHDTQDEAAFERWGGPEILVNVTNIKYLDFYNLYWY